MDETREMDASEMSEASIGGTSKRRPALIALIVTVLLLLLSGAIYRFWPSGTSDTKSRAKSQGAGSAAMVAVMTTERPRPRPMASNMSSSAMRPAMARPTMAHVPAMRSAPQPPSQDAVEALFRKASAWCKANDRWASSYHNTPTLHAKCVDGRLWKQFQQTGNYDLFIAAFKYLIAKFCTRWNRRNDTNMPRQCRRLDRLRRDVEKAKKIAGCKKALHRLLRQNGNETGLSWKCRRIRWHYWPLPRSVPYCKYKYKSLRGRNLPQKCLKIFKVFPNLRPRLSPMQ